MKSIFALIAPGMFGAGLLASCTAVDGSGGGQKGVVQQATKEQPFVNSLGMKFVPVPGTNILMCTTETTVAQYRAAGMGYQAPQFAQSSNHPAVNISWNDAKAWCEWLSKREHRKYRLQTFREWLLASGNATYPWGNSYPPPNNIGNYAGQEMRACSAAERDIIMEELAPHDLKNFTIIGDYQDRNKFTAPVGSYQSNLLGIHELGGNANEWCDDWQATASGRSGPVLAGGSWFCDGRDDLKSRSFIVSQPSASGRRYDRGFRCVVER